MRTSILVPPADLPVTWDMVRSHLRLDELSADVADSEQTYAMNLAAAATLTATSLTRCALLETQYEAALWAGEITPRPYSGFRSWCGCGRPSTVELDWPPLVSVDSVTLGDTTLLEGTDYWIWKTAAGVPTLPGTLTFRAGLFSFDAVCSCAAWAAANEEASPLRIQYTAGYGGTSDEVPADVRSWILLRVGALYGYREESAEVRNIVTMPFADSLLNASRWFTFA